MSDKDRIAELEAEVASLRAKLTTAYEDQGYSADTKDARIAELEAELNKHVPPAHIPEPYPAMRYHADGRTLTVANELDDDTAHAEGFGDVPVVAATLFPSYRYKKGTTLSLVVNSQADVDALGDGWSAEK